FLNGTFSLGCMVVSAKPHLTKLPRCSKSLTFGGGRMRQFGVGDVVTCIPDMFLRYAAPGDYKIVAAMPDRDGDRVYRINSPLEEQERVVLVNKRPHRRITLPTLQAV